MKVCSYLRWPSHICDGGLPGRNLQFQGIWSHLQQWMEARTSHLRLMVAFARLEETIGHHNCDVFGRICDIHCVSCLRICDPRVAFAEEAFANLGSHVISAACL